RGAGPYATPSDLARALEDVGGHLDAATYRDFMSLTTPYAPGGLSRALAVLAAVVGQPHFRDLEVERRIVLEEMRELEDDAGTEIDADNLARALLFEGHALGRRIDGARAVVCRFKRRHLVAHHRRCFGARNMALVVAGPDPVSAVSGAARRCLSRLPAGERLALGDLPALPRRAPRLRLVRHDASQTEIRFCFRTPGEREASAIPLLLARRVLDDGMGSRLQTELVDRRGLAYELWADLDLAADVGVLDFGAVVEHRKVARTVRALLTAVRQLARDGPTGDELRRAKRRALWSFAVAVDAAAALADWIGRGVLFDLDTDIARIGARIRAVRPAQVRDALRRVVDPASLCLVAVGRPGRSELAQVRRALRFT
ncbi:MAG: insulinase family protein, partial [Deltaproteobacteria bacterium]|nr:insulinase family protein [Deltaproteobacteria bacterium]